MAVALCGACSAPGDGRGFLPIFDGRALANWRAFPSGTAESWTVVDRAIRGTGLADRLAYLVYAGDESLADFELKLSYRMLTEGNTGIEVRARVDDTGKRPFVGYHADLGHAGIGPHILGAWDFHFAARTEFPCQRGTRLVIDEGGAGQSSRIEDPVRLEDIRERDWNRCHVIARGNHLQFFLNGKLSSEFIDGMREGYLASGAIALQLHDKGMVVEFKDILLKGRS